MEEELLEEKEEEEEEEVGGGVALVPAGMWCLIVCRPVSKAASRHRICLLGTSTAPPAR